MFEKGADGGLGDGCLRWLLSRGFRREDQEVRCLVSDFLDVKETELLVGETSGGGLLCSWYWFNSKGRSLRRERRYR